MRSFMSAGSATLDAGVMARLAAAKSTTTESRRTIPTNVRVWIWNVPSLNGVTPWACTSSVETMTQPRSMAAMRFMLILLFLDLGSRQDTTRIVINCSELVAPALAGATGNILTGNTETTNSYPTFSIVTLPRWEG